MEKNRRDGLVKEKKGKWKKWWGSMREFVGEEEWR